MIGCLLKPVNLQFFPSFQTHVSEIAIKSNEESKLLSKRCKVSELAHKF